MKRVLIIQRGYLFCSVSCVCELCVHADAIFDTVTFPDHVRWFRDVDQKIPGPAEFHRRAA